MRYTEVFGWHLMLVRCARIMCAWFFIFTLKGLEELLYEDGSTPALPNIRRFLLWPKIVLIGAGSHSFSKNLITDILTYPEFKDSTVTLMDIAAEPLELAAASHMNSWNKTNSKHESNQPLTFVKALRGANYVIVAIKVGGANSSRIDKGITLKYGITKPSVTLSGPEEFSMRRVTYLRY